jgi:hypothetical protein
MLGRAIDRHELAATYIFNNPGLDMLAADPGSAPLLARMRSHPAPLAAPNNGLADAARMGDATRGALHRTAL